MLTIYLPLASVIPTRDSSTARFATVGNTTYCASKFVVPPTITLSLLLIHQNRVSYAVRVPPAQLEAADNAEFRRTPKPPLISAGSHIFCSKTSFPHIQLNIIPIAMISQRKVRFSEETAAIPVDRRVDDRLQWICPFRLARISSHRTADADRLCRADCTKVLATVVEAGSVQERLSLLVEIYQEKEELRGLERLVNWQHQEQRQFLRKESIQTVLELQKQFKVSGKDFESTQKALFVASNEATSKAKSYARVQGLVDQAIAKEILSDQVQLCQVYKEQKNSKRSRSPFKSRKTRSPMFSRLLMRGSSLGASRGEPPTLKVSNFLLQSERATAAA